MAAPQIPVGIDLGTTFSAIACVDADGRPRTLVNGEGDLLTPSVVFLDQDTWIVGREAVKAAAYDPDRVAMIIKREMGESFYSRPLAGQTYPPEVLQSLILEKLKRDAERLIGPIRDAVITVPAFFNETRRQKTHDAAILAGINVLDIINEPTAAALVYGVQAGFLSVTGTAERRERIVVYDLGGGTFDVTITEITGDQYRTLATDGDVHLGGIDWDRRLVDHLAEHARQHLRGKDLRDHPRSLQRLFRDAEDAKRALSVRREAVVNVEDGDTRWQTRVSRDTFEQLTADLLERTRATLRNTLQVARLTWSDITRVLLVGGSTRMPAVERMLAQESGLTVDRSLSPDEAVAQGAALFASLHGATKPIRTNTIVVQDVNSHSLGIRARDPAAHSYRHAVIIPKNTPLPITRSRTFATAVPDQRRLTIDILEGEAANAAYCSLLGRCAIEGLPPDLPERTQLEIEFHQSTCGRLVIRWRIPTVNAMGEATIDRKTQLSRTELQGWSNQLQRTRHDE